MPDYPVLQVLPEHVVGDEALGSKTKFWFQKDDQRWLFKETREGTGEDWAEKIAAEVARISGISAATVELAEFQGRRGCACLSFVDTSTGEGLLHGNEILAGMVLGYDRAKKFHQSDHTLQNIEKAIRKFLPDKASHGRALTKLASYIVLDALIGNTDRHHENWALLLRLIKKDAGAQILTEVAPSFDHASSLGRELLDDGRTRLLDSGSVGTYVRRGHGAIYEKTTDRHGVNPLSLAEFGARHFPEFFMPTLQQLKAVPVQRLQDTVIDVPSVRMSDASKTFVRVFFAYTYDVLTRLVP